MRLAFRGHYEERVALAAPARRSMMTVSLLLAVAIGGCCTLHERLVLTEERVAQLERARYLVSRLGLDAERVAAASVPIVDAEVEILGLGDVAMPALIDGVCTPQYGPDEELERALDSIVMAERAYDLLHRITSFRAPFTDTFDTGLGCSRWRDWWDEQRPKGMSSSHKALVRRSAEPERMRRLLLLCAPANSNDAVRGYACDELLLYDRAVFVPFLIESLRDSSALDGVTWLLEDEWPGQPQIDYDEGRAERNRKIAAWRDWWNTEGKYKPRMSAAAELDQARKHWRQSVEGLTERSAGK